MCDDSPDNVQVPAADKGKFVRDSKTHHSGAGIKKIVNKIPPPRQGKTHQDAEGDVMRGLQVVLLVFSARHLGTAAKM